jgi:ribosomal protein L24
MVKTRISKGDKVRIIRGEGRSAAVDEKGKAVLCTVLNVDRATGRAFLEIPRPKTKRGEREKPVRGIEVWKTVRYNAKRGEAGGLKIVKRPIHVSNLEVVEKAPPREFPRS